MTISTGVWEAKTRLSELIGKVMHGNERVLITRKGRPVAALVSTIDLARLEALDRPEAVEERRRTMEAALSRITAFRERLQAESGVAEWPSSADVLCEAREEELE